MQPHRLDEGEDLGLGSPEAKRPAADSQSPRDHRQVKHQRSIGEHELGEVDDDVGLCADRADERLAATTLRRPVFITTAPEH